MPRNPTPTLLAMSALAGLTFSAYAQFPGHYPPGVEGIKGPSLPPPGIYLRDYNLFYTANDYPGSGLNDFEALVYVNAPRLIYMTAKRIPGANCAITFSVPFAYTAV